MSSNNGDGQIAAEILDVAAAEPKSSPINPYDLNQARKKVRSLLKTGEGLIAFREGLLHTSEGRNLVKGEFGVTIVDRKEDTRPVVAILVPTHKAPQPETGDALQRMITSSRDNAHIVMRPSVGSSVVHWCRNYLLAKLYESKTPFDYVLFMDDDMVPSGDSLSVLLGRKVDVIGAVCTVRQDPPLPNVRYRNPVAGCYQTADIERPGIWNVSAVGTGFILISKKALDAVGEYTLKQRYFREHLGMDEATADAREAGDRTRCAGDHNAFWFEFLKDPKGGELGEDISFCLKARECGFEVYADSTTIVGHIGNYAFGLQDYWAFREEAYQKGLVIPLEGRPKPKHEEYEIQLVEG